MRANGDKVITVTLSHPEAVAVRVEAAKAEVSMTRLMRRALNEYFASRGSDVRVLENRPSGKPGKRQAARLRVTRQRVVTASELDHARERRSNSR